MSTSERTEFGAEKHATVNDGIEICFQELGDPDGEPLVLIMGLAMQMTAWDPEFCAMLGERGYRVIRFDNRDIGLSTTIDGRPPSTVDMLLGRGKAAYTLIDMAADVAGLLDHLEIDSAHIVGASMGGMIAQQLAIDFPDRVRSLGLIMTTPGGRLNGLPTLGALKALFSQSPNDRDAFAEYSLEMFGVIGSPDYPADPERVRTRAREAFDRSRNPAGVARQLHGISRSPNRTKRLEAIEVPTVVIHGEADPLVRPSAGRALARAIPKSRLKTFKGMGHDLPPALWPEIIDALVDNAPSATSPDSRGRSSS